MLTAAIYPVPQYPGPVPIQLTLLSSMFMHGSWMHILGNMLYLWIFGDQIEDALGHFKFLAFYIVCGVAAAFAQIFYSPDSVIPTLGASGAIAGVLGAYLIKHPTNRVRVLMLRFVTHMPAAVVLGFWIVLQIFSQVSTPAGKSSGVAYMAHIGGFVAGRGLDPGLRPGSERRVRQKGLGPGRRAQTRTVPRLLEPVARFPLFDYRLSTERPDAEWRFPPSPPGNAKVNIRFPPHPMAFRNGYCSG